MWDALQGSVWVGLIFAIWLQPQESWFFRDHCNAWWSKFSINCAVYIAVIVLNCKIKYIVPPLLLRNAIFHKLPNSTFSKTITIPSVVIPFAALLNSMPYFSFIYTS